LARKLEGKGPLGRSRRRLEGNIRMKEKLVGGCGLDASDSG
jgi:hypothetical protein